VESLQQSRRRLVVWALVTLALVVGLYVGLPKLAGLEDTWGRISRGDPWWLAAAVLLEACSYGGYVVLFRGIFAREGSPLNWRACYEITMAGVAATRVFAAGGAGGIALTAWALTRAGMSRREIVAGLSAFLGALYAVFMGTLIICGLGLRTGVLPGEAPFGVTVVPAALAAICFAVCLTAALLPHDLDRRLRARLEHRPRLAGVIAALAGGAAAVAQGVRGALRMLRARDSALLGAVAWWAFDIGVLWACFHAFGEPPTIPVLVMAYFTGMLGNLLPLPGGIGGVEGGMIGALIAFDVPSGLAVVSVLSYRAFAFWLPTVPGLIAYLGLRRTVKVWETEMAPAGTAGSGQSSG
jgi:uncharacterized membrane protein YbhN (UPF0104 family)